MKRKIIGIFLLMSISLGGFSNHLLDKKHSKYTNKVNELYASDNYYKLYKQTGKALESYPNDTWFNYLHAYSLYYARTHKKIKKEYGYVDLLPLIINHLQQGKPIQESNDKFSKDLQKELYSKSKKLWNRERFEQSLIYLDFWFGFYDNTESYQNLYYEAVQEDLFKLGRKLFVSSKKEKSEMVFAWMQTTFYESDATKFTKELQEMMYSRSKAFWDKQAFEKSLYYLNFWFKYYDNSNNARQNLFANQVQDDLFLLGKKLFNASEKEKAKTIFDWIFNTFYESNFEYKYDGTVGFNQSKYQFKEYRNPLFCLANTAKDATYLTEQERELIYLQNLVRINPQLFNDTYVTVYYKNNRWERLSNYAKSLVEDLNQSDSKQILYPDESLFNAAQYHANDLGMLGKRGHTSSDGTGFSKRLRGHGVKSWAIAENCSYGFEDPLKILMQLLIDDGVPSLGHRKTILSDTYSKVGVAIRPHTVYRYNSVLDYGK